MQNILNIINLEIKIFLFRKVQFKYLKNTVKYYIFEKDAVR